MERLLEHYAQYEYKFHSLRFPDRTQEINLLSASAKQFISKLDNTTLPFNQSKLNDFYNRMNDSQRIEVLAYLTIDIHEFTHHVDLITTPFGVNFHAKSFFEYLQFQHFGYEILKIPELIHGRLIDFDDNDIKNNPLIYRSWKDLRSKIFFFNACYGQFSKISNIAEYSSKTFNILNKSYSTSILEGFMATIKIPNIENRYLRPITILETRGLINSLQWILYILGNDDSAKKMVVEYVRRIYGSDNISPDYKFLLDLFAAGYGKENFINFLSESNFSNLNQNLTVVSGFCWYALQSPPLMNENDLVDVASPIARLLIIIMAFQKLLQKSIKYNQNPIIFESVLDIYNRSDTTEEFKFVTRPIDEILNFCLDFIEYVQKINKVLIFNTQLRNHYEHIFNLQRQQINNRKPYGYLSPYGLPYYGNPLKGISYHPLCYKEKDPEKQLLKNYTSGIVTQSWFDLRQDFVFGYPPPKRIKEEFEQLFNISNNPLSSENKQIINDLKIVDNWNKKNSIYNLDWNFYIFDDLIFIYIPKDITIPDSIDPNPIVEIIDFELKSHAFINISISSKDHNINNLATMNFCPFLMEDDPQYNQMFEAIINSTLEKKDNNKYEKRDAKVFLINEAVDHILHKKNMFKDKKFELMELLESLPPNTNINFGKSAFKGLETAYIKINGEMLLNDRSKLPFCSYCWNKEHLDEETIESINRGLKLMKEKKYGQALNVFSSIKSSESKVLIINLQGQCMVQLEKFDKAIEYFDEGLKIDSNNPEIVFNKGYTLFKLKRYDEAITYFNSAFVINKWQPSIILYKSITHLKLHQMSEFNETLHYGLKMRLLKKETLIREIKKVLNDDKFIQDLEDKIN